MPHSSDDPPGAPPAESGESASQPIASAEDVSAGDDPQSGRAGTAKSPRFPRRRRRRPRRPRPDQASEGQSQAKELALLGDAPATDNLKTPTTHRSRRQRHRGPRHELGSTSAPADEQLQFADATPELPPSLVQPGGDARDPIPPGSSGDAAQSPAAESSDSKPDGHPRRRRRRRRAASPVEAALVGDPPPVENATTAASEPRTGEGRRRVRRMGARTRGEHQTGRSSLADGDRGVRARGPGQRRGPVEGRPDRKPRGPDPAERGREGGRDLGRRGTEGHHRDSRDRRARGGEPGRAEGRRGKGRNEPKRQPERRLYALELVVDRGFEDVTDEAGDSETQRVHWTIIKRMVADQQSGKPISAVYVLQRDGVDTEFPSLGTARAAANKTIVHPEKLTLSKAEHAAEHAAAKK